MDYSARIVIVTIYVAILPHTSAEKFTLLHIKFNLNLMFLYLINFKHYLSFTLSLCRYGK